MAIVASGGVVTALASGTSRLTATYQGIMASDTLTVLNDSDLFGLTILSCSDQLLIGQTVNCNVTMTTSGASNGLNVASKAMWSSTNSSVLSIAPGGRATAVGAGTATIAATYHGKTASLTVSVTSARQDALQVDNAGHSGQFRVGSAVSMSLGGIYSVVSGASGQLSLRITDQGDTLVITTAPTTVPSGSNSFFLIARFIIPQGVTKLCSTALLQVGSNTVTGNGLFGSAECAGVVP